MIIRRAKPSDAATINALLYQVAQLHADGRPDIFRSASKKYTDEQLIEIINCDVTPIFVAEREGAVVGYAFCKYQTVKDHPLLQDKKSLYIDDLCVDERARGARVGTALYEYVLAFAKANGFDAVTLNVWAFNQGAYTFYEKQGMTPQRIVMEKRLND